ncbi:hypothetical protein N0824_03739 [Microcystis sp. 0824]|nr:hypothetical protein N0824_03739 [Microcystis sp. 0824]
MWGVGCGVSGFTHIFREKVPEFPPDNSNGWHFLILKRTKDIIQQGF